MLHVAWQPQKYSVYDYFVTYRHIFNLLTYRNLCIVFCDLQTHFLFCDLQTHFLFCDLQTLLDNWKSGATVKYLWVIRLCTVDPVWAEYTPRPNLEKKSFLNDNQVDYCDYFVTYMLGSLEMPICQKPKDVLHITNVQIKYLPFLSQNQGEKNLKKIS